MLSKGDKVLVAYSGGPDSTFLLHALMSLKEYFKLKELSVFYLNHMLRGEESKKEEEFVKERTQEMGINLIVKRCDIKKYAEREKTSIETTARKIRYLFYKKIKEEHGFTKVALGHTFSDSFEWFLLSLLRGKAIPILTGIPPVNEFYIRPLISLEREEIIEFLRDKKIPFFEDSSNLDTKIPRNYMRNLILPHFKKLNISFLKTMQPVFSLGEVVRKHFESPEVKKIWKLNEDFWLDFYEFLNYNPLKRFFVLKRIKSDIGSREIMMVEDMLSKNCNMKINFNKEEGVERSYGWLIFLKGPAPRLSLKKLEEGESVEIEGLKWRIECKREKNIFYDPKNWRVYFDRSFLKFPVKIRGRKDGDRMVCLGMKGSKKVKEIFIEKKIPKRLRELWPLVISEEKIIWIPGLARSSYGIVSSNTKEIIRMEVIRNGEAFPI